IRREVQVSEQDLTAAKLLALGRERLLHLDDHLGAGRHRVGASYNFGTHRLIVRIRQAGADAGTGLNNDLMPLGRKLAHSRRHKPNAIFAVLRFLGHTDKHCFSSYASSSSIAVTPLLRLPVLSNPVDLSCKQCFGPLGVVPGGLVTLATLRAAARTRLLGVHNANKATPAFARREDGLLLRLSS